MKHGEVELSIATIVSRIHSIADDAGKAGKDGGNAARTDAEARCATKRYLTGISSCKWWRRGGRGRVMQLGPAE